ncbi:MAG: Eco57I restriction-modification methylase domain-containing protein [Sphaerochaetaceae bacterium]|nr:Eco57I restriction-modification methylase domain-containing protein [Sphaerochaetaceae bacterium]
MADLFSNRYNPDVLSCLANLSNDEVFTPPSIANQMLDLLPQELFENPNTTFLDPCCKSGVFLREIARRLIIGLEDKIPNLQNRLDNIYHNQIFGVAITELTSLLSRRSVYCSKYASSKYSVSHFDNIEGNIRFKRIEHTWNGNKCIYCGASKKIQDRGDDIETHAYEFIHKSNLKELNNMKFDVIIGNPPYQISDGGGNGASAKPIYNFFVDKAKKLNPRFLTMIIPSRWFNGGKGLDEFRNEMLHDKRIIIIHDFPDASSVFPGVQIKGGVSYFLFDRSYHGDCTIISHDKDGKIISEAKRPLLEKSCDSFIRYNESISILHKVQAFNENTMEKIVSPRMPFNIPNTIKGNKEAKSNTDLKIYVSGNNRDIRGTSAYIPLSLITKGRDLINKHKVYIGKAGSGSDSFPHPILPTPFYGEPNTVCNESYLVIGPFNSKQICNNVISYISTKFFRFFVLLKKNTQNAAKGVYTLVPQQDFSKPWTDDELYKKYGLAEDEIAFIEFMIKPMKIEGKDYE